MDPFKLFSTEFQTSELHLADSHNKIDGVHGNDGHDKKAKLMAKAEMSTTKNEGDGNIRDSNALEQSWSSSRLWQNQSWWPHWWQQKERWWWRCSHKTQTDGARWKSLLSKNSHPFPSADSIPLRILPCSNPPTIKFLLRSYTCKFNVWCLWCPLKVFMEGAVNFLNLPMMSGFTPKIYTLIRVSYNLGLVFSYTLFW